MINQIVTLELELCFPAYSLTWNLMKTMILTCASGLIFLHLLPLFLTSSFEPLDQYDIGG